MSEGWSGRRGSNPRPTAWKAVTLPLSYSRLRARLADSPVDVRSLPRASAGKPAAVPTDCHFNARRHAKRGRRSTQRSRALTHADTAARRGAPPAAKQQRHQPSSRCALNPHAHTARKVGGEGRVRTSVARRRQVYSLLRLTALPPPRNTSLVLVQGTTCLGLSVCIL